MINDIIKDAGVRMVKCTESFESNLTKLRTGRAHPSLLEHLTVDYYGSPTGLNQVANIAVESSRMLTVTPWEKNMVAPIEKAIMIADLGLNPATSGMVIRVPLPPLTEERRRSLTKVVRDEAEKARIAVRNVRRDAINDIKELLKAKEISEDEERKAEQDIQKVTDNTIKKIDVICGNKEKDLMEV
jgi:ribosome recycling factor